MTDPVERFMTLFEQVRASNSKQYTEAEVRLIIDGALMEERNRLADELQKMPLNDTANSIAIWIREGGND